MIPPDRSFLHGNLLPNAAPPVFAVRSSEQKGGPVSLAWSIWPTQQALLNLILSRRRVERGCFQPTRKENNERPSAWTRSRVSAWCGLSCCAGQQFLENAHKKSSSRRAAVYTVEFTDNRDHPEDTSITPSPATAFSCSCRRKRRRSSPASSRSSDEKLPDRQALGADAGRGDWRASRGGSPLWERPHSCAIHASATISEEPDRLRDMLAKAIPAPGNPSRS